MEVNTKEATDFVIRAMKKELVPMLTGDPGTGKSALIMAIAKRFNLELIDIRLSQYDPTDLSN